MAEKQENSMMVKQKLGLIEKYETGESVTLAIYGIGWKPFVTDNKMKFGRCYDSGAGPSNCSSMKKSSYTEVGFALLQWFNQKWAEGTSVSGPMCARNPSFLWSFGIKCYFNASVGWLTTFKQQYGIHETAAQGET